MELKSLILLSLINTAFLIIAGKWGIISWYQSHRAKWMPSDCNFCCFFWMAFIELVPLNGLDGLDISVFIISFFHSLACSVVSLYFYTPRR